MIPSHPFTYCCFFSFNCVSRYESGLLLSMLEPVDPAYCERTVEDGDTLAVEYEGRSATSPSSVYSNISATSILSRVASS